MKMNIAKHIIALTFLTTTIAANTEAQVSVNRTNKKIVPIDRFSKEWTIQILSMKRSPRDASFFNGLDNVYEVIGKDGWRRYCIGQYSSQSEAEDMLSMIKKMNDKYKDAFVTKTRSLSINKAAYSKSYGAEVNIWQIKEDSLIEARRVRDSINAEKAKKVFHFAPETSNDEVIESPYKDAGAEEIDEKKAYAVQIIASRYPIYKEEIVEFENVEEFYMADDEIYRYTTEMCDGEKAKKYLDQAHEAGYTEAVIINYNVYKPYLVK